MDFVLRGALLKVCISHNFEKKKLNYWSEERTWISGLLYRTEHSLK